MSSKNSLNNFKRPIVNLSENDIHIDMQYKNPKPLRKILGMYTIRVNDFEFTRYLRFTDIDGYLPSLKSSVVYPFIMLKYLFQKLTKKYIVKNPKPFIVVDAVEYMEKFIASLDRQCSVLEVGAGNSSLWFLSKGCKVLSFEHNKEWASDIVQNAEKAYPNYLKNLQIDVCQGPKALHKISHVTENFDIILIDSMNEFTSRFEAIKILKNKVSEDGILVLDNSDGPVNWKALSEMQNVKFERFTGYAYNCPVVCQTTIWQGSDIVDIKS
jgi:predicted O-methyltransferase YrrM